MAFLDQKSSVVGKLHRDTAYDLSHQPSCIRRRTHADAGLVLILVVYNLLHRPSDVPFATVSVCICRSNDHAGTLRVLVPNFVQALHNHHRTDPAQLHK